MAYNKDYEENQKAEAELNRLGIRFKRNDIPDYSFTGDKRYSIFVFGADVFKLYEFKKRYMND